MLSFLDLFTGKLFIFFLFSFSVIYASCTKITVCERNLNCSYIFIESSSKILSSFIDFHIFNFLNIKSHNSYYAYYYPESFLKFLRGERSSMTSLFFSNFQPVHRP